MGTTEDATSLNALASQGTVPPDDFSNSPERVAEVASIPLVVPDLQEVVRKIMKQGLYVKERVEDAVVAALIGNVILAGPPGTGKTKLSSLLADAFNVSLRRETANPEWSVYDVIGSQSLDSKGGVQPRHGIVTRSILDCAATTVRHLDKGQGPQGQWLLIDEMNRAEIDRAFGPLFTALSGDDEGQFSLDYMDGSPTLTIPRRFRILCTMNDYDTRFVNSMSGALRRRFARVLVLPPTNVDGMIPEAEWSLAVESAQATIESRTSRDAKSHREGLETYGTEVRRIFGGIRRLGEHEGIAVGTSQLIDCCTFAMAYLEAVPVPSSEDAWHVLWDRVLETRLISGLETDSTRIRMTDEYLDAFEKAFPALPGTRTRLKNFLRGSI